MTPPNAEAREARKRAVVLATPALVVLAALLAWILIDLATPRLTAPEDRIAGLASAPKRATNRRAIAGDAINLVIVGSDSEIASAFRRAGWVAALPVTRASSFGIAESILLRRPDSAAPVSPLFLFGRQQDLAFEREVGRSASRRHHVRLWRDGALSYEGRAVWLGGATFDLRAGISHRGFHPTHHIAPDVDTERDTVVADLLQARQATEVFRARGLGPVRQGQNAEGDRFYTDGELRAVVIPPGNVPHAPPEVPGVPFLVRLRGWWWRRAG